MAACYSCECPVSLVPSVVLSYADVGGCRDQEMSLRMAAKSANGRERAVEHILNEVSYTCPARKQS
jgi:hypothetical protein